MYEVDEDSRMAKDTIPVTGNEAGGRFPHRILGNQLDGRQWVRLGCHVNLGKPWPINVTLGSLALAPLGNPVGCLRDHLACDPQVFTGTTEESPKHQLPIGAESPGNGPDGLVVPGRGRRSPCA